MNTTQGIKHAQEICEMYESLLKSINQAGGSSSNYTTDHLSEMTVMELISRLATNRIRFIWCGPEVKMYKPKKKEPAMFADEDEGA